MSRCNNLINLCQLTKSCNYLRMLVTNWSQEKLQWTTSNLQEFSLSSKQFHWRWFNCHWNCHCKNMQHIIFRNSTISANLSKSIPLLSSFDYVVASATKHSGVAKSSSQLRKFDISPLQTFSKKKYHSKSKVLTGISCDGSPHRKELIQFFYK